MMVSILKRYKKDLNNKTPGWFKDWYAIEFVPVKVRQDILIVLATGTLVGIIIKIIVG